MASGETDGPHDARPVAVLLTFNASVTPSHILPRWLFQAFSTSSSLQLRMGKAIEIEGPWSAGGSTLAGYPALVMLGW